MDFKLKPLKRSAADENLEHQRLKTLINSMADAVITVDENIKIATYNAAALNLLDINNIKTGVGLDKIFSPMDKNNQPIDIIDLIKDIKLPTSNRDYRLKYGDGSIIDLYTSIAPVRLGFGEMGARGFVILLRDITREKSLEEERDEFVSVVSHELRTPIAITEGNISNAQYMVERNQNAIEVKKALNDAHEQVLFLADLINDLATLSRAERGKLTVDIDSINVSNLIEELTRNYLAQCQAKGLKLKIELDPKLELLMSSKLYVKEILQNFVTNAIKYTNEGYITITAKQQENAVRISVADTGIGISKGDQDRVFDKFFRSEDYRTRQSNGTGLGLYVTMKLTSLIHAHIDFASELNKGSIFTVTIPNMSR